MPRYVCATTSLSLSLSCVVDRLLIHSLARFAIPLAAAAAAALVLASRLSPHTKKRFSAGRVRYLYSHLCFPLSFIPPFPSAPSTTLRPWTRFAIPFRYVARPPPPPQQRRRHFPHRRRPTGDIYPSASFSLLRHAQLRIKRRRTYYEEKGMKGRQARTCPSSHQE